MIEIVICLALGFVVGFVCARVFAKRHSTRQYSKLLENLEQQWGERGIFAALEAFNARVQHKQQEPVVVAKSDGKEEPQAKSPQPEKTKTSAAAKSKKRKPNMDPFSLLREVSEGDSVWSEHANDLRRDGIVPQFLPVKQVENSANNDE